MVVGLRIVSDYRRAADENFKLKFMTIKMREKLNFGNLRAIRTILRQENIFGA